MKTVLFPLLLAASNTAIAQKNHEIFLSTGAIGTHDENWSKVQYNQSVPGAGLSVGTTLSGDLSGFVSFHTGTVGSSVYIESDTTGGDEFHWEPPGLNIAATIDQYAVGAKWRVTWLSRLASTLTGSAIVAHGRLRMDEDIELEGSEVELKYVSVVPGVSVGTGIEFAAVRFPNKAIDVNLGLEAGYAYIAPFQFKDRDSAADPLDIGSLDMNGVYLRWSLGTRF